MLGIIGGTGLYKMDGFSILEMHEIETPFGPPSAPITIGKFADQTIAFLPRHGVDHTLLPGEINYRANIFGLKTLGVHRIYSISATGSLKASIIPGDIAVVSQYLDWTRGKRQSSFFGNGIAAHVSTGKPSCPELTKSIIKTAQALEIPLHTEKAYACVEGPRFGTQVESFFLRNAGCDLVGMTNVPEAFLAREAQICYCTIAVATDYDCWMEDDSQHVTVEKALSLYKSNLEKIQKILSNVLSFNLAGTSCKCRAALMGAVMTKDSALSESNKKILNILRS